MEKIARLPQDTIELTTRPRGQSSEEYWMTGILAALWETLVL